MLSPKGRRRQQPRARERKEGRLRPRQTGLQSSGLNWDKQKMEGVCVCVCVCVCVRVHVCVHVLCKYMSVCECIICLLRI